MTFRATLATQIADELMNGDFLQGGRLHSMLKSKQRQEQCAIKGLTRM